MKRKHSVGWFSSYDRGLDVLLQIWPYILEAVPDATLDVAYGWNIFDKFHKQNPAKMKWKWQMIKKFNEFHVKEHGRLSHEELAKLMQSTQTLAYCTSFPEIDCITVKKAQAAGMDVITSGYAALQYSVWSKKEEDIIDIDQKPDKLKEFAGRVIDSLLNPLPAEEQKRLHDGTIERYDWSVVAKQWSDALL